MKKLFVFSAAIAVLVSFSVVQAATPSLTLDSTVSNDSGLPWLGYQVDVIMNPSFTFATPDPSVTSPAGDWFVANVVDPTLQTTGPNAGMYEGTIFYSAGTPIGVGGQLSMLYSISFTGATDYSFTQNMTPWFTAIPEPSALALVGLGGLVLMVRLARKSHGAG